MLDAPRRAAAIGLLLPVMSMSACDGGGSFGPPTEPGNESHPGGTSTGGYADGPCTVEGQTRDCEVALGTHGEVLTCLSGSQTCSGGAWSDCHARTMTAKVVRKGGFADLAATLGRPARLGDVVDPNGQPRLSVLSADAGPVSCMSPCSPTCQELTQTPTFTAVGTPTAGCTPQTGTVTAAGITSCSFTPAGGFTGYDTSYPLVQLSGSGSTEKSTVPLVSGAPACDPMAGGFYYDDFLAPTRILLCPASCAAATAPGATTSYALACASSYVSSTMTLPTFSVPADGEGSCPEGYLAQWDYLAFSAVTPGSSGVTFSAQTSVDGVTFVPAMPVTLAVATRTGFPYPQYCPLGALPGSVCPVDVYGALAMGIAGGGPAQYPNLLLSVTLDPATESVSPSVSSVVLTYSCVPGL